MTVADADRAGYELDYVDETGQSRRGPLSVMWGLPFERVEPVRSFRWSRGLRHWSGWWWSSTSNRHVGFESWLERDHAMLLDFDPDVTGFASQPFWLHWPGEMRRCRHAPDFFARLADGSGVVIDVRPDERIEPDDADAFAVMSAACAQVGWQFRRVGAPDPVVVANVRWLSRYRHPRYGSRTVTAQRLLEVFEQPIGLLDGVAAVGDRLFVLPVLYHLLWRRELVADLVAEPVQSCTLVRRVGGDR